ncbi:apoptosis-stimulating of p53 protein 2-like, partial [Teleopsis dalmanni]|uniref:apoptosis-stimulating of p53 protein 2-like n=1 Tax=Teleopsis dalmanni TaxID=139649 RepID=UPI0018CDB341
NDLDSIRALFSEKEKELSLAVAKVEALTRQLEDLRRDRRCPINLLSSSNGTAQALPPQASRELEKLRRELMYRNQLTLQQDARLHLQREALQQRQAELRSVDQRIYELQTRLQRKKAANIQIVTQNQNQLHVQPHLLQQQQQQQQTQLQQQQQTNTQNLHQQLQQQQQQTTAYNADPISFQNNVEKQGVAALKQQLLQKQTGNHITDATTHGHTQLHTNKFSNIINREQNRNIPRGNVAAVEPYIHTPQKSTISSTSSYLSGGNILKHSAATANTNLQNQLIQDLTHVKLNLTHSNSHNNAPNSNFFSGESDETKLAKKMLTATITPKSADSPKQLEIDTSHHIYAEIGPKKRDLVKDTTTATTTGTTTTAAATNLETQTTTTTVTQTSKIPKSIVSTTSASAMISKLNAAANNQLASTATTTQLKKKRENEKKSDVAVTSETLSEKNTQQLTVHSMPLDAAKSGIATAPAIVTSAESLLTKPKPISVLSTGNLAVPPRKPISSVAPSSVSSSIPKIIAFSPKVNRVAPNVIAPTSAVCNANDRPALPPKPSKMSPTESTTEATVTTIASNSTAIAKPAATMEPHGTLNMQALNINDNLPIKAKPLTIRKQPMSEQPRLKLSNVGPKPLPQPARKIDIPTTTALLYSENNKSIVSKECNDTHINTAEQVQRYSPDAQNSPNTTTTQSNSSVDETDKTNNSPTSSDKSLDSLKRRMRASSTPAAGGKPKLTRRVSFDPLALLLDASLEGELELVKKTAMQVTNPSAANDEGITALHNAICAGHFDIVKFLVEFGCDVNAQDSDGWTPLHCAASCNNLSMVKFLVESGACLFAATLSDHETPAEKCEEDEEGFDGCSEYLYSIQEKLGILHNGEVHAVFSYEAQNSDELTFNVNDRLIVLRKGDDAENEWWWAKNSEEKEGYVPRNLLGLYPRIPPQNSNFID